MRITKLFFTILSLAFFTSATKANIEPTTNNVREEIEILINKASLSFDSELEITLNFLINNNNEIIVVSTNNPDFESQFRSILNLKKIKTQDVTFNKMYTLPIKVKKM